MSDTTFVDFSQATPIVAVWLNDVNVTVYRALGAGGVAPTTAAQVVTNLGVPTLTQLAAPATGAGFLGWIRNAVGAVATTLLAWLGWQPTNVMEFMSDAQRADVLAGTLTLDVSAAIQAALNSGAVAVTGPPAAYKCSSGITIPAGVAFFANGFMPSNPPFGAKLVFDLAVPTCVTMGGASANNKACSFKGFNVLRAAGTPPAGSIGVLNKFTYGSIVEDINSVGHAVPFYLLNDQASLGIDCQINRLSTGAATDSHIVIDSWPEAKFNQCRFGMNGAGDQNCGSFVRIQGGSTSNPADGPNTVVFGNCQFNQGANLAATWLNFANKLPASISDSTLFQFDNCYIETSSIGISSDATWTNIQRLQMSNVTFNMTAGIPFASLHPASAINNWELSNCIINGAFAVAPASQINFLNVSNTQFLGAVSVTGVSNSVVSFADNNYAAGLTIAGNFSLGVFKGGSLSGGALTNTATGGVLVDLAPSNLLTTWIPNLTFGGSSTGITYSVQQATYQTIANMVFIQLYISLTSKGSAAGAAQISNLPVPEKASYVVDSGGGAVPNASNLAGLTGSPVLNVGNGVINFYQGNATGQTAITDANFTNTSLIRGTLFYVKA